MIRHWFNAWMASPGHRHNILSDRYQEIGVALEKGIFQGQETWVAVQVFALPLDSCPPLDDGLHEMILAKQASLNTLNYEMQKSSS